LIRATNADKVIQNSVPFVLNKNNGKYPAFAQSCLKTCQKRSDPNISLWLSDIWLTFTAPLVSPFISLIKFNKLQKKVHGHIYKKQGIQKAWQA
jgi:hypothetical protein